MPIQPNQILQRNLSIPSTHVDEDIIAMNLDQGEYYVMDNVAAQLWTWLEKPATLSTLLQRLHDTYDVQDDDYQQQTQSFLEEGLNKNLFCFSTQKELVEHMNPVAVKHTWPKALALRVFDIVQHTHASSGAGNDANATGS